MRPRCALRCQRQWGGRLRQRERFCPSVASRLPSTHPGSHLCSARTNREGERTCLGNTLEVWLMISPRSSCSRAPFSQRIATCLIVQRGAQVLQGPSVLAPNAAQSIALKPCTLAVAISSKPSSTEVLTHLGPWSDLRTPTLARGGVVLRSGQFRHFGGSSCLRATSGLSCWRGTTGCGGVAELTTPRLVAPSHARVLPNYPIWAAVDVRAHRPAHGQRTPSHAGPALVTH